MTTKTKTLKADARGRIRFTKYGFRFEIDSKNPTTVTVYTREAGDPFSYGRAARETEIKLGTVNLISAAFRLLNGTEGDATVTPVQLPGQKVKGF